MKVKDSYNTTFVRHQERESLGNADHKALACFTAAESAAAILSWGDETLATCPICKGMMRVQKSSENGHLSACCIRCKRQIIE